MQCMHALHQDGVGGGDACVDALSEFCSPASLGRSPGGHPRMVSSDVFAMRSLFNDVNPQFQCFLACVRLRGERGWEEGIKRDFKSSTTKDFQVGCRGFGNSRVGCNGEWLEDQRIKKNRRRTEEERKKKKKNPPSGLTWALEAME